MKLTWLIDGRLAASGMVLPEDVPEIRREGVRAILSLTERSPFPDGQPEGIDHLHLPVADFTAPPRESLERGVAFLGDSIRNGKPVVVHCGAGLGRTGTMLAAYLVAEGEDPVEAIRRVREARPGSIETREQEQCIRDYAEAREKESGHD